MSIMNIGDSEDKTGVIHKICVNNEEIKTVDKLELLGVILDSYHISLICKKASQRIGVLMRLKNLILTSAKLVLYVQNSDSTLLNVLPISLALL